MSKGKNIKRRIFQALFTHFIDLDTYIHPLLENWATAGSLEWNRLYKIQLDECIQK